MGQSWTSHGYGLVKWSSIPPVTSEFGILEIVSPADTKRWINVGLTLVQRRRRRNQR